MLSSNCHWDTPNTYFNFTDIPAVANLLEIKRQISEDPKGKPPAVLCVLCGMANAAYQRPDGVFVVPITALKN